MKPFRSDARRDQKSPAEELKYSHRRALRLDARCARALRSGLRRAAALENCGDEALRRLKLESGQVEACLPADGVVFLPAFGRQVRILRWARELVGRGENHLNRDELMRAVAAFDEMQMLEMAEIQRVPQALRIALCEALVQLIREILHASRSRLRAQRWIQGNGRRPRCCDAAFLEHALRLAAEAEKPELHAQLTQIVNRCGERINELVERAHHHEADLCLRLGNLMQMKHMLNALNWEKCFEQLSAADIELHEDPASVYSGMDAPSRALVREAVAELAARLHVQELTIVRYGLKMARDVARSDGVHNPRATVCWYLLDDEGRADLCAELGAVERPSRRIPDACGNRTVVMMALCVILVAAVLYVLAGTPLVLLYALPLAWVISQQLIGRFYPHWVKPLHLPRLKMDSVPDCARTLVALPVLLSSEERAREMIMHMEALGCLEKDENIDFLLLGDFRDSDQARAADDDAILETVRRGMERLNAEAGRRKYFYLHRARSLRQQDDRWMGKNRKRGALTALNHLLLMRDGARQEFQAEGSCAAELAGRYRYVVTLDADTEYLPGTLQKLIGAMCHPLNRACIHRGRRRGYAVLQPNMQLMAEADVNEYVHLMAGEGGVDHYPVSISDFYQDITGRGNFAGKGIYDVRAFTEATEGKIRDDEILSHDLIEGILSRSAFLGDVSFYDRCPDTLGADLGRLHRWTRGDWQLLPVLFSRQKIAVVDRLKMLGNLLRSLYAPALLMLLIHGIWMDRPAAFAVGLLAAFHEPLIRLPKTKMRAWKAAVLKLAVLPAEAGCMLDAILRTLWRLGVSHKHLMEWTPAADAGGEDRIHRFSTRIAALLLLPGLLRPFWIPAVLALAALFLVGVDWANDLARSSNDQRSRLNGEQKTLLKDLARRTWKFFETYVPADGNGLPPDNVQLDPPVGEARRTSPTNIGLYLMSCIAARELGFISDAQMLERMESTVNTLEKLEKWNGQLYNWYDIDACSPLRPRYVSAVDSGNLAGALLLCMQWARNGELAERLDKLVREMNLAALYDAERELFRIGMDVEGDRLSDAHYDLYASEARILSYTAMMLGQVPLRHWKRLSRAQLRTRGRQALLSWSGTMFEYLMPELLLRSHRSTLAGESRSSVTDVQMQYGKDLNRPWGVSESGYHAFDMHLNYQYRAFGLRVLALSGNAVQDVVAPYAAALALAENSAAAADNLRRMCELGWAGEFGMFEAADYLHLDAERKPRLVRSHMAHHQGMALCAICNALQGDVLSKRFMEIPEARSLRLLLQEKRSSRVRAARTAAIPQGRFGMDRSRMDYVRTGRGARSAADTHLLYGAGTTALITARGGAYLWSKGYQINRFFGDLQSRHEGLYVHLEDVATGRETVVGEDGKFVFDAGYALCREEFSGMRIRMQLSVSPEDGIFYQQLEIENTKNEPAELNVCGCMAVALAPEKDMRSHPVFQNLFVQSEYLASNALVFRRRSRTPGVEMPELVYAVSADHEAEYETMLDKLVGRSGSLGMPGGIAPSFTGETGWVLNPCAALRVRLNLEAGGSASLHFALGLVPAEKREEAINAMMRPGAPERAMELSSTQARAMLAHVGIDPKRYRLLQRVSALFFDAKLRPALLEGSDACAGMPRSKLWSAGISGDLPILLVVMDDARNLDCIREALHMHAFYRMMGVKLDFVLINNHGNDYHQPGRDAIGDMIASSHLNGCLHAPGGAFVLERQNLDEESYVTLRRAAALCLDANQDVDSQLRAALDELPLGKVDFYAPMAPEEAEIPGGLEFFNGYGGFDANAYVIALRKGVLPPAPWCNVLASDQAGAVITERGGGFAWHGNSRSMRFTPFANDALREGWGWMFYLMDDAGDRWLRLLPGDQPMTDFIVRHECGETRWQGRADGLAFEIIMRADKSGVHFELCIKNRSARVRHLRLIGFVDWLMGTDGSDTGMLRTWSRLGACFASGAAEGVGCFASDDPRARTGCDRQTLFSGGDMMRPGGLNRIDMPRGGWTLQLPMYLRSGEERHCRFLLGWAKDIAGAYALAREFRSGESLRRSSEDWQNRLDKLHIETPDPAVNCMVNGFLQAQILNSRIRGRTGLYQPGGAYGFRDQLQDMLPMIHYEPQRVRRHLLYCAARQFEAGDVLHWWHDPYTGVRTHISDDLLFLPWVTAQYVKITGDEAILWDRAPFLEDIEIPEGREDIYAQMRPSAHFATLHEHCMRAFRRAARTGVHGLCLMGTGDWNDGMNRVAAEGRGESIWLSEFLAACAAEYAAIAPQDEDRAWLMELKQQLCAALEDEGWDGEWYLRAYTDEGKKLGGRECGSCRIDAISQAWAVFAGLNEQRCKSAVNAAWNALVDEKYALIRLLDPPFDGVEFDPGYIAAYPPGIRENGAQYTHAACWVLISLIRIGDARRAHRALDMLLPVNHARSEEAADIYRVEPYVMAADVYTNDQHPGRGGWTWYTGSAAWLLLAVLELLGYERRGDRVRMNALLGNWPEASISLRVGLSTYRLVCRQEVQQTQLDGVLVDTDYICLKDDGRDHIAVFPPRKDLMKD